MGRFLCTYYSADVKENVSKENKHSEVLTKETWLECANHIRDLNFKYIKYIRNLESEQYSIYNTELIGIETYNNERLKFKDND